MSEAIKFLFDGPADASQRLALAHGAGAPMDSPFMTAFAEGLGARGIRVARFEFPYMAARRNTGRKLPPDRQPVLLDAWARAVQALGHRETLVIGGKSMGGRLASMVADTLGVRGLACLGYPFHPPGKPAQTRITHLADLKTPALIVQGTRDPLGGRTDVAGYALSPSIEIAWIEDGDHDLKPLKRSGRTQDECWRAAMDRVAEFMNKI
ncbi:MAG: alpha/beta hydrolase [Sphingomonadales bacterium]|nr:alpha/beta hydrolase [Sphingomonadales bacterium]